MIGAAQARLWRLYADTRRSLTGAGSARPGRRHLEGAGRADVEAWLQVTADRHDVYRATVDPLPGTVAMVCVTSRPQHLTSVVQFAAIQDHPDLELIVVTNSSSYDRVDLDAELDVVRNSIARTEVLRLDPSRSLGSCLNAGMAATDARFVAKIDDDDRYGSHYISDSLRAHRYAGAGVVGKHSYFAVLADTEEYVIRFPGHEFFYSSTLAGGTLVIDRDRTGTLSFQDRSLGEDRAFIAECHRNGVSTFSADRFGFVQVRGADNTWSVPRERFLEGCSMTSCDGVEEGLRR